MNMKLLFELSSKDRKLDLIPPCDSEVYNFEEKLLRKEKLRLPEVSEVDLSRHYSKLAKETHGVNDGFYPLGSCTMKYNPAINETIAADKNFTNIHPLQPVETVQGCLEVLYQAKKLLCEITGMDDMSFQPAAGAHGEYAGLILIKISSKIKMTISVLILSFLIQLMELTLLVQPWLALKSLISLPMKIVV